VTGAGVGTVRIMEEDMLLFVDAGVNDCLKLDIIACRSTSTREYL